MYLRCNIVNKNHQSRCVGFSGTAFFYSDMFLYFWTINGEYEGWNFNSGNYLFTTDTK